MAISIRATWLAGFVDGGSEEIDASAEEGLLDMTGADVAVGTGTDLNRVLVEGKEDGAFGEW